MDFEVFKNYVCHQVKWYGEKQFIKEVLLSGKIPDYFTHGKELEALYLLAMLDYLSHKNNVPEYRGYDQYRAYRFEEPIYPRDVLLMTALYKTDYYKEKALAEAIPEFLKYNIIEADIDNVG